MSFPFQSLSAIGVLVILACLQSCASRPAAAPALPSKARKGVAVAQPQQAEESTQVTAKDEPNDRPSSPQPLTSPTPEAVSPPQPLTTTSEPKEKSSLHVEPSKPKPTPPSKPAPSSPVPPKPAVTERPRQSVDRPKPAAPVESHSVTTLETSLKKSDSVTMLETPDKESDAVRETTADEPDPAAPASLPEVTVTLESLPLNIQDEWMLSANGDFCTLSTSTVSFDDGQGLSKLQLVFTPHHWLVKTQSDIDMSYSGTGLTVDEGRHFPLDQVVRESDLMFTLDYAAMTQAFIQGRSLRITLGFWPSWPVTETKTVQLPLTHFARAHRAWELCQSLINAR